MKPIFWIHLILNIVVVLGVFAYLISRIREAANNSEIFFKMKKREKNIYLTKKHVDKNKKYQSPPVPDSFIIFQTILCFFLLLSDLRNFPWAAILYIPSLLLRFGPVTFTIEKESFSFTHFAFFTKRFFFKDLKQVKVRYVQSFRGNSRYVISTSDSNQYFSKDVSIWNQNMLHLCFIDAVFRSNPNIEMEIVESNHQPMLELQDLMLARKPLGIFQDDQ